MMPHFSFKIWVVRVIMIAIPIPIFIEISNLRSEMSASLINNLNNKNTNVLSRIIRVRPPLSVGHSERNYLRKIMIENLAAFYLASRQLNAFL